MAEAPQRAVLSHEVSRDDIDDAMAACDLHLINVIPGTGELPAQLMFARDDHTHAFVVEDARLGVVYVAVGGDDALLERITKAIPSVTEERAATLDTLPRHLERLVELPCGVDCFYWYPGDLMDPLFIDIGASFSEAIAALERAAACVPPRRVSIGGIPACVVPESLQDHFVWSYEAHLVGYRFARIEPCGACSLADSCPGILPVYLEQRGAVNAARAVPPAPGSSSR